MAWRDVVGTREVKKRDQVLERIIGSRREEFDILKAEGKMRNEEDTRDLADLFFMDQDKGRLNEDQVSHQVWSM